MSESARGFEAKPCLAKGLAFRSRSVDVDVDKGVSYLFILLGRLKDEISTQLSARLRIL